MDDPQAPLASKLKRSHMTHAMKNIVAYVDNGGTDLQHVREIANASLTEKATGRDLPIPGQWSERHREKLRQRDQKREAAEVG